MGGAETVKEVNERQMGGNGGQMGDAAQVHRFLGVCGSKQACARLTARHHVLMVAED
ncbi:hypothetical protein SDC9_193560 [bioreactor metagenome]|uniref:Uncharacterized protein n=1 Tax=bioreactor metagenome TaxID=1076179 RepID=A0A645I3X0_9ZZZZ